jgi:hypothetical protein
MSLKLQNPLKDPSAVLDYVFDWTEWLATGETIDNYTITADTGITVDSSTEDTGKVTVWLSGGTAGINYKVACKITTSAGRTDERTIWIKVVER